MIAKGRPNTKPRRPVLKDLLNELVSVNDWQLLMINMGVEKFENDKIERNHPNDIERQKQEAFEKWLKTKPDACWKDVIDALYKMKEITLASSLEKKYAWKDPRVSVNGSFLCTSYDAPITAKKIDRRLLDNELDPGLEYYTFDVNESVQPIYEKSAAAERTTRYSRILQTIPRPDSLEDFFKSIEDSSSKGDFKVGLEARFGNVYWKLKPENVLPKNSTNQMWIKSKLLRKAAFNTQVEEADVERLVVGREQLGLGVTKISVTFEVEGQDEGRYSAAIAMCNSDMFYLDAVYRKQPVKNRARLSVALPGYKYDLRISDCSECILLAEYENSIPYKMARKITSSLCRLPGRKLRVILHGSSQGDKESSWKVEYIRQRVQRQYEWKPEKKWILAQYDVDVFTNKDTAPQNEGVDILEFDYSRKEVELWGQKIYPRNVSDTHPSRHKYYYMEGIEGVQLPGGELREPYNWTTEELLRDFEEFLGDAFKIAHILDGSPY